MDWPGEKLVIRLWDTIEASGTGLLRPWQLKRVENAKTEIAASRLSVIATAERHIAQLSRNIAVEKPLLRIASNSEANPFGSQIEPTWDVRSLEQNITSSQSIEYCRKEVNIEKAVSHAESSLEQDAAEPPTQKIDADWFFRWRDYAGGTSSDSLQQIWGHVLAGEVKAPGTFTYRTLDFLRNLTQDEAKLIERLATVTVDDVMVFHGENLLRAAMRKTIGNCLTHEELSLLEELGVVGSTELGGYIDQREPHHLPDGRHVHLMGCKGRGLMLTTDDPKKVIGLSFYRVTKLGANVLQLVQATPDEVYFLSLGQMLADNGFRVEIGNVVRQSNSTRSFENPIVVEPLGAGTALEPV